MIKSLKPYKAMLFSVLNNNFAETVLLANFKAFDFLPTDKNTVI